jgi:RimJ/RimL family protein N-acetyltransferase
MRRQCLRLKRIAVQNAGRGIGSSFLRSVLQICYDDLAAHRVELFVFEDNERAYRTYVKTGFVEEGTFATFIGMPMETFDRCA